MRDFVRVHRIAIILILLILVGYILYTQWLLPIPSYSVKYDPEMQYLLNSLALFKGVPYNYIDHPGTPLEVIGTLLLAITRPLTRSRGALFIPYHLTHPELFLTMTHLILSAFSLFTTAFIMAKGLPVRDWKSLLGSIGVGLTYFAVFSPLNFGMLDWWTHNAFNLSFGTLLFFFIVLRMRRDDTPGELEMFFFGILAGCLIAVQLYFVAWAAGVVAMIVCFAALRERGLWQPLKAAFVSMLGVGVGFFVSFLPVLYRFRSFFLWVKDLIIHQGRYGSGEPGIATAGRLIDNLRWLYVRGEFLMVATLASLILLGAAMAVRRKQVREYPGWWAGSLGALLSILLLWGMIVKHPGVNYLVSSAALLPMVILLALEPFLSTNRSSWIPMVVGLIMVFGFLGALVTAVLDHNKWSGQIRAGENAIAEIIDAQIEKSGEAREDLTLLWGYGVPSRCFALRFANVYTLGKALEREINEICPNEWMYDVWGGFVEIQNSYTQLSESEAWDILVLPERYIPEDSEQYSELILTDIPTRRYGRIAILVADQGHHIP